METGEGRGRDSRESVSLPFKIFFGFFPGLMPADPKLQPRVSAFVCYIFAYLKGPNLGTIAK